MLQSLCSLALFDDLFGLVMVGGALITLSTSSFIQEKREVQVIYACGVDLFCIHFATSS